MATKKATQPSEYDHQCALIAWCEKHKERIPDLGFIFASNNGIRVSIGVAVKMKKAGMKKGVPDLFLPIPRHGFSGFFIEMKVKGGSFGTEQADWFDRLQEKGYRTSVYYSWWDAAAAILSYLDLEAYRDELIGDPAQYVKSSKPKRKKVQGVRQTSNAL